MRRTPTAPRPGTSAGRSRRSCGWRPTADSPGRCSTRAAGPARTPCTSPSLGLPVLGVDVAETALAIAREKAAARGIEVEFAAADALHLDRLGRRFETVLDCGLFHTFDGDERPGYVASLASVTERGGTPVRVVLQRRRSRHRPAPRQPGRAEGGVRRRHRMACRRRRTGPDPDEIPRRRRTGLARDDHPDLGTGRAAVASAKTSGSAT